MGNTDGCPARPVTVRASPQLIQGDVLASSLSDRPKLMFPGILISTCVSQLF